MTGRSGNRNDGADGVAVLPGGGRDLDAVATSDLALKVDNAIIGYGHAEILHGVSFAVRSDKVTAVLGRNGVGKTTLLRSLSGLLAIDRGTVSLYGDDITKWPSARRVRAGLVQVPEGRRMVPGLTVAQMLRLGAYVLPSRQADERTDQVLHIFPIIKEWLNRESTSLSGGQQQLVAIARALMSRPRVVMLDEPLTGLAPSVAIQVMDAVKELASEGLTILLVEQNVHMALDIADYVWVIDSGQVLELKAGDRLAMAEQIERTYLGVEVGEQAVHVMRANTARATSAEIDKEAPSNE